MDAASGFDHASLRVVPRLTRGCSRQRRLRSRDDGEMAEYTPDEPKPLPSVTASIVMLTRGDGFPYVRVKASAISRAVWKRSSGLRRSARSIHESKARGISGRNVDGGGGAPREKASTSCPTLDAGKGRRPVIARYATTPSA